MHVAIYIIAIQNVHAECKWSAYAMGAVDKMFVTMCTSLNETQLDNVLSKRVTSEVLCVLCCIPMLPT